MNVEGVPLLHRQPLRVVVGREAEFDHLGALERPVDRVADDVEAAVEQARDEGGEFRGLDPDLRDLQHLRNVIDDVGVEAAPLLGTRGIEGIGPVVRGADDELALLLDLAVNP